MPKEGGPQGINQRYVMFGIIKDAMPAGIDQADWYTKAKAEGVTAKSRMSETKRDLQEKKLVHEYGGNFLSPIKPPEALFRFRLRFSVP